MSKDRHDDNHHHHHDNAGLHDSAASKDSSNDHPGESGDDGPNDLHGNEGDDNLNGHGGDDRLDGGPGDDHLTGGKGHDLLHGGPGHDRFDFNSLDDSLPDDSHDVIGDFHHGDKIDLRHIDAEDGPGNQRFHWIGDNGFHNQAGELHFVHRGHGVVLQGDTDGDGNADFEVVLHHINGLHRHDIIV